MTGVEAGPSLAGSTLQRNRKRADGNSLCPVRSPGGSVLRASTSARDRGKLSDLQVDEMSLGLQDQAP